MFIADHTGLTAMKEALLLSHDPTFVAFRLRRLKMWRKCVLWTGMCMFAVQITSRFFFFFASVLTVVCQSIGFSLSPTFLLSHLHFEQCESHRMKAYLGYLSWSLSYDDKIQHF